MAEREQLNWLMPRTPDIAQADMRPLIEAELTDIYRSHTKQGDVYLDIYITNAKSMQPFERFAGLYI